MLNQIIFGLALVAAFGKAAAAATDVLTVSIATAGQYEIHYWVPFGSLQDSVPGVAHVLEHLKFAYGGPHSLDGLKTIQGSVTGASTTYRYTQFEVSIASEHLAEALKTLSLVAGPLPIEQKELSREQQVVSQELIERQNANPDGPFYEAFERKIMDGTPYAFLPGGTLESVAKVTMDDVAKFNAAHYVNANGFLVIAGPPMTLAQQHIVKSAFPSTNTAFVIVDRQRKSKKLDTGLGAAPAFLPPVVAMSLPHDQFQLEQPSAHVNTPRLIYSKLIPASLTWKQMIASIIIESAMNSRLQEGLTDVIAEDTGLVQRFNVNIDTSFPNFLRLDLTASLVNGVPVQKVTSTYDAWLKKLTREGLTEKTFSRIKARFFLHDEWDDVEARLRELSAMSVYYGFTTASSLRATLQDLKLDDANGLLRLLATDGRVGLGVLQPQGANP